MPSVVYFDPVQKPSKRLKPNVNVKAYGPYREFEYRITTNAQGFRNTYPFAEDLQSYSLVVLGDSQSFGVGINDDQTFASRLAKGLGTSVLNTACPGYNTMEELLTYKNRVRQFKPHSVLLFFFSGNDPYENFSNRNLFYLTPLNNKQNTGSSFSLAHLKKFLSRHSAIYYSLIRLRQTPQINHILYQLKLLNPLPPSELAVFEKGVNDEASAHWQITEKIILNIRDEIEADGCEFKVVLIPDRFQVDESYWYQWVAKYRLDPQKFDLMLPNQHLAGFCKKNGIAFADPTEALIQMRKQGKKVYWEIDNHLNARGHQTIADFIISHWFKTESPGASQ